MKEACNISKLKNLRWVNLVFKNLWILRDKRNKWKTVNYKIKINRNKKINSNYKKILSQNIEINMNKYFK